MNDSTRSITTTATIVGGAAVATVATWLVVRDYLAKRRIRAEREASPGPRICTFQLTPAGLQLDGMPIDPDVAATRCIAGGEIIADPKTTWAQRAAVVTAFQRAGTAWLMRFW